MAASRGRGTSVGVACAFAVQAALLALAVVQNVEHMNPDGVAYVRLAGYWRHGDVSLAVTGYWPPLLSWLIALFAAAGLPERVAAWCAVAVGAVAFLAGAVALLRAVGLRGPLLVLGAWLCALAGVRWSTLVNPDLLAAGLLGAGLALLLSRRWVESARAPWAAGVAFGAAYLAKSFALPFAAVVAVVVAAGRVGWGYSTPQRVGRALAATGAATAAVAAPWILAISLEVGSPTLGTSGRINHALTGPSDGDGPPFHPYARTYHEPEPGRLTQWEDPSRMAYRYWSPLASREALDHQLAALAANARIVWQALWQLDRLGIGMLALVAAPLVSRWRGAGLAREPWRWLIVPAGILCAMYVPLWANSLRYYFPLYPWLVGAGLGLAAALFPGATRAQRAARAAAAVLVAASLVQLPSVRWTLQPVPNPEYRAAQRLLAAGVPGPVAGVARPGSREAQTGAGLALAYFAGLRYLGSELRPAPERIACSGAALLVASRGHPLQRVLDRDPRFETLDGLAFGPPAQARRAPVAVYRVRPGAGDCPRAGDDAAERVGSP